MSQTGRNLLFYFTIVIFSFVTSSALADICQRGKSASDQAVAALQPAAAAGAGSMGMGSGISSSFPAGTNPSGGKGAALGAAAAKCSAAAQQCKSSCDKMAQYYNSINQPSMAQQSQKTGDMCMQQNKPMCDQAGQQAQADQQHQQQGQQAAPSAQQQPQQMPEDEMEEEEEEKYAGCPKGLTKQGEEYDGKPLCGCPAGKKAVATSNGETVDLASQSQGSDLFSADEAKKYKCVAVNPEIEENEDDETDEQIARGDTSALTVNSESASTTTSYSGDPIQSAYGYESRAAISPSSGSGFSANAYGWRGLQMQDFEGEEEEDDLEEEVDEIAYVPPQLMNSGSHRRIAAVNRNKFNSYKSYGGKKTALGPRTKAVGTPDPVLATPPPMAYGVDAGAVATAKALMDPKAHTNPHIEIDKEGQKIAMLLDSPDPLSLCKVSDRIRMLESGGVYAVKRAVELRNKFNSRLSRFGGETGLDVLCTTSDNSF